MRIIKVIVALLVCVILFISFSVGEDSNQNLSKRKKRTRPIISEVTKPGLTIKEGYVSRKKETIKVLRDGKVVAKVRLGEPIMLAQANKEEPWGFFQFPGIYWSEDGKLIASWQMNIDSYKSYGKDSTIRTMSIDGGKTWKPVDKNYLTIGGRTKVLHNGNIIQISTPPSKDIHTYASFPAKVCSNTSLKMDYYLESELPDDLRGMYMNIRDGKTKKSIRIHGELNDPGLIRYAIDGSMPIMWWGDINELQDGTLVGGIYRTYYKDLDKGTPKSCITFYKSNDGGYHWIAIGRIPYRIEEINDKERKYDNTRGFSEASFVILKDSIYFCVMRTGYNTPMYKSFSKDGGVNWTEPEAFTPNGVYPQLLQLDNGMLVLASGRPGLQLRFCIDGDGKNWTEPIEMLSFMDEKGKYDMWDVTCGYPRLLKSGENSFYMVYSDFKSLDSKGKYRKSIMFRKIEVVR